MRTTLDIDADVLHAARALAGPFHTTSGRVTTDWMQRTIAVGPAQPDTPSPLHPARKLQAVYGFVPLTSGGKIVTIDLVRALRDELGD